MLARDQPDAQPSEAPGDDTAPPDWIREAWRLTLADFRAFARTAATLVAHPRRFAAAWAAGRERALNPLAFLATSAAVLGGAQALLGHTASVEQAKPHLPHAVIVAVGVFLYVGYAAVVGTLGAALVGAHGSRAWKGVAAIAAALAVSGVVYGFWRPPATIGAHFVLWLTSPGPYFSLRY
jgi:hypothetical protein